MTFSDELFNFLKVNGLALEPSQRVLVACSAGPDSVALLRALRASDWKDRLVVGHVNHQLRGKASDRDALFVVRLAKRLGLPSVQAVCPVAGAKGNLEENARDARYAALAALARAHGCAWVVTAHTRDDQAETILLNLFRGSGPDGLAGMAPARDLELGVRLVRPMLSVGRIEVMTFLRRLKQRSRTDATNRDTEFRRNWLRRSLLPAIEKRFPDVAGRLAASAAIARDEKQFWTETIAQVRGAVARETPDGALLDMTGLLRYSAAVQRRVLRALAGGNVLTFDAVERLRAWMASPPGNGRRWQLRRGWTVERLSRSKGAPTSQIFFFHQTRPRKSSTLC